MGQDDLSDIKRRLQAAEQDAAAARILAGAADRDVTEIRAEIRDFRNATTASFNALRQDFVDLRGHVDSRFEQVDRRFDQVDRRFQQVDRRFEHVDRRFDQVDGGFVEMRGRLDATVAGQQRIVELIESLIDQQNR
ncbi:hypothetical protein [Mycolicibacterium sp.]|uniref:hypothetical protein n=1 Tax=Mycolicibacterium sp. TaxID=2320850 RepID=UPI003453571D